MKKQKPFERGTGVLLPVTSLPSPYGIGAFGKEAYEFVDFLKEAGQKYWQVLPLGPTSYGDSPYQSFSAFAGNPYFIDLDTLAEEKLISKKDIKKYNWGKDRAYVDYAVIYENRFKILRTAYENSSHKAEAEYKAFYEENSVWLDDYSLYMSVKNRFGGAEWLRWDEDIRMREPEAVEKYCRELADDVDFWKFCQYEFSRQWAKLKDYANSKGIEIIGDIPIYVSLDSADVWVHSEQFQLDERHRPTRVAGVPPDMFSATGQLWGNPLYNYELMEKEDYAWWKQRMGFSAKLYDVIRIDHFVGFAHYYSIAADEDTAMNGVWIDGPREKLLSAVAEAVGGKKIIAEDLGIGIPEMGRMMKKFGLPGMRLMTFGFDNDAKNTYLPSYFEPNSVIYGGTHDNETLAGYFSHQPRRVLRFAREYLNVRTNREIPWGIIREGYKSVADTVIFQMQDFLGLGAEARINTPSTIGENWRWRLTDGQLTSELAERMKSLAETYGR